MLDPSDDLHDRAVGVLRALYAEPVSFVTNEAILPEVLAMFSRRGPARRQAAVNLVRETLADGIVECLPISRDLLLRGISRYEQRPDKTYSLVDCISMEICDDRGITDILTYDEDFVREGFAALLR